VRERERETGRQREREREKEREADREREREREAERVLADAMRGPNHPNQVSSVAPTPDCWRGQSSCTSILGDI